MENSSNRDFGIVVHFDEWMHDVYSGRKVDFDAWIYALKAYGGSKLAVIENYPINKGWLDESIDTKIYSSFEKFLIENPDEKLVHLECEWTIKDKVENYSLLNPNYKHPENCWYVFGPANGFNPKKGDARDWLAIPQIGTGAQHSTHIVPIILFDRFIKG